MECRFPIDSRLSFPGAKLESVVRAHLSGPHSTPVRERPHSENRIERAPESMSKVYVRITVPLARVVS